MKRVAFAAICLALLFAFCACTLAPVDTTDTGSASASVSATRTSHTTPTLRPARSALPTSTPDMTTSEAATEATPTGPSINSGYAYMTSYDPARGFADFDYIELLEGEEAVQWLINEEGMDPEEAEWMAEEYYTVKNVNPLIRTLDLREAEVTVLFDEDGVLDPDHPVTGDLLVLYNLYELDPNYVLNVFFYYVEVGSDGIVTSLTQIFTP